MVTELRVRNQSQQLYVRTLSQAWRNGIQLYDPSLWLLRDPELEEKMLRDADIAHAIDHRRRLVAGKNWELIPRVAKSDRGPIAVSVATELLGGIRHFPQALLNLARAFFSGARFARVHYQKRDLALGDGVLRTWHVPTRLEDLDKRMFRIVPDRTTDGGLSGAHWERWNVSAQKFEVETVLDAVDTIRHVYEDDQATLGHGRALREALGWWWYAKTNVFQESLQAIERFAQGIITAKIDGARDADSGKPNQEVIRAWQDVLENMRSRHVLVYDKQDEIEMVKMDGQGWQMLKEIRDELRATIFTLILSANLPTAADEGGSYALANVQENSTEALVQFDRHALEETLTDDLLGSMWFHNHANLVDLGIAEEKPRFSITQEKIQDPQERATVAQTLNSMGVELSLEDVLEQTGFRKPEDGEEVIAGRQEPDPIDPFGGGGGGDRGYPGKLPFRRQRAARR